MTTRLKNFPFVNQLNSPTLDGKPDENKLFNCVICGLLSIILFYHPDLHGKIEPDSIKDAVLGENYANKGTDIRWFLPYAAKQGINLTCFQGTNAALVAQVHKEIQSGHPVLATELDPYVDTSKPEYAGWLHSFTFFEEESGSLTIMDPFGGKLVTKTDAEWERDLRTGEIWIGKDAAMTSLPAHLAAAGWTDNGTELRAPNGHIVVQGFRDHILKASPGWPADNVPMENARGLAQLLDSHPELGGGVSQLYRDNGLIWLKTTNEIKLMPAGEEILKERDQISKLYNAWVQLQKQHAEAQAQVTVLQAQMQAMMPH